MSRSRLFLLFLAVAGLLGLATIPGRAEGGLPTDGTPLCDTAGGSASDGPSGGPLRIATFNLLHSESADGRVSLTDRIPLQADAIVRAGASAVGLQEVTNSDQHPLVVEQLAEALVERTGEPWHWCWSRSNPHALGTPDVEEGGGNQADEAMAAGYSGFREGLGIVSRFPIVEKRFRRLSARSYEAPACYVDADDPTALPAIPEPEPGQVPPEAAFCPLAAAFDSRQVLWGRLEIGDDRVVDLFTTHIAHELSDASDLTKELHVREALLTVDEWSSADNWRYLVGDFNTTPENPRYGIVDDAGFVDTYLAGGGVECGAPAFEGCTGGPTDGEEVYTDGPTRFMHGRIDYVWAKPPSTCPPDVATVRSAQVIADDHPGFDAGRNQWFWPSDHHGVMSHVEPRC